MMITLLPSEIARLVLNYLEEENLIKTYDSFLNECKYLEECKLYINRGIQVPRTIHGKKLIDFLVIDLNSSEAETNISTPLKKSTKITKEVSIQTEITSLDHELINNLTLKRKCELNDSFNEIATAHNMNSIHNQNIEPLVNHQNENIFLEPPILETPSKKKRLLIGKNIEKQPILSVSTLERQLNSIINDAAEHLKQEEEYEQQQKQQTQFIIEPTTNEIVLFTSANGTNTNEQNFNFEFIPSTKTVNQNTTTISQNVSQIPTQKPAELEINKHFNLKNALTSNPDDNLNLLKASTRSQTALRQLNENVNPTNNVVVKKKRVYRRITPTIRTIYENNSNSNTQNQEQQQQQNLLNNSDKKLAVHMSNTTSSILIPDHSNQPSADLFDIPLNTSSNNKNSVTTDDELDMIFGTSVTTNSNKLNNSSLIDKLLVDELNSSKNNKSLIKDDDFDLLFGPSPVIQNNSINNQNQSEFDVYRNTRSSSGMNKTPATPIDTPNNLYSNQSTSNKKFLVGGASINTTPSIDNSSSNTRALRSRTSSLRKMM